MKADGTVDTSTYLTSYTESQTLDSVTDLGASTTNTITVGGVVSSEYSSTADIEITAYNAGGLTPQAGNPVDLISFIWNTTTLGVIDTDSNITFNGFKTPTGTAAGFLKADGSVDTTTYLSSAPQRTLDSLSDVDVSNPSNADFLVYDDSSGEWVSSAISLTETDPVFTAHAAFGVTSAKISNWDTAYGWGNHSGLYALVSHAHSQYATLASPTFTGTPLAPTAASTTNNTQIATTAFVTTAVSNLVGAAPGALDTLDELAAALGDDANFSTTVTTSIAAKLPLAGGTLTGNITAVKGIFESNNNQISIIDSDDSQDFRVQVNTGVFSVRDHTNSQTIFKIDANAGSNALHLQSSGATFAGTLDVGSFTLSGSGIVADSGMTLQTNSGAVNAVTLATNGNATFAGTVSASNFSGSSSGTNTGDQTFATIGAATRLNYDLKFQPATTGGYGGFTFLKYDGTNAGYLLVKGTSSNDVYTANGITLVADGSWLTLAQRTTNNTGIRFMTGATAVTRMTIASNGDVDIVGDLTADNFSGSSSGTNTGDQTLPTDFVSAASGGTFVGDVTFEGGIEVQGTITESSSIRFKENIKPLEPSLDKVERLNPVTYNKIGIDEEEIGLIAEEVSALFPEVVTYNEEGQSTGIQYQRLSVILLKAMQELTDRVKKLEKK